MYSYRWTNKHNICTSETNNHYILIFWEKGFGFVFFKRSTNIN